MVATSCDLKAPRCTTIAPPVRFHGPRGGVFVGHRPPRDPGDPRLNNIYIYKRWKSETKFYVCSDVPHTHTPCTKQGVFSPNEVKMRMTRNESEMSMKMRWKLLNRNPGRGTHKKKRRNQEKTPTPTHLARSGRTLKRQGKRKSGGRQKQTQTGGGGGGRKRLNQPKPQRKQGLPKQARTRTYLEAWNRGPMGT